jgi:hypothetical protein
MRVAAAKLDSANSIMQAQVESAQKEFDLAQGTANAFLRYCGNELEVTFDDGMWGFDEQLMCFVRKVPDVPPGQQTLEQKAKLPEAELAHVNGKEGW